MTELEIGAKVKDRYTLKEFKGSGSFGEVWLAHDDVIDLDVALKIYISLDPRGIEEFRSEYVTTQGLSHPNLLTTDYYDIWEHRPFLVMKYCANGSSSSLVGRIDERLLWQFIHDVASGLEYLHDMPDPIIHQDIKPDNILIDDNNRFLITDFGISKRVRSTMRKQSRRAVGAGATAYMGPERFESNSVPVKASDIWSLGASIYELAMGELPFSGLGGGMQKNGAELPSLDDKWSRDLDGIMKSCLAKETWDRPTAKQIKAIAANKINSNDPIEDNVSINTAEEVSESSDNIENKNLRGKIIVENTNGNNVNKPKKRNRYSKRKLKKLVSYVLAFVCVASLISLALILYFVDDNEKQPELNKSSVVTSDKTMTSEEISELADVPHSVDKSVEEENSLTETGLVKIDASRNNSNPVKIQKPAVPEKTNEPIHERGTATMDLGYGSYTGVVRNGKPHGKGRIVFRSSYSDNLRGYSAEAGDYIEGYFTNGKLDQGTLFKNDGTRIKSVY